MAAGKSRRNYSKEKAEAEIAVRVELQHLMAQFKETLSAVGAFFVAQKNEVERKAEEARQEADSAAVKAAFEETKLKRLEADRTEFEARITKAQLEKTKLGQGLEQLKEEMLRLKNQGSQTASQGRALIKNHPARQPSPRTATQQRMEEKPLTATIGEISEARVASQTG